MLRLFLPELTNEAGCSIAWTTNLEKVVELGFPAPA